jgi:branched-chain amino acid transport system ATP-binding protein
MLTVSDLHTYYGDSHVLQGVSLRVPPAAIVAVLGRNGVGKTTLCRSIVGFTPPRSGTVVVGEVDVTGWPPHRICDEHVRIVPQGRRIFPSLTVAEHLQVALQQRNRSGEWDVRGVYELFPRLKDRSHHRGSELSGGEQQMLAIARALVANPALLVMDEPTEGLAPAVVSEVGRLIRRVRERGAAVLLAEQNAAFGVQVAEYVYVMSQGRIVHAALPQELWADESVKTRWLGIPGPTLIREAGHERPAQPAGAADGSGPST